MIVTAQLRILSNIIVCVSVFLVPQYGSIIRIPKNMWAKLMKLFMAEEPSLENTKTEDDPNFA